MRTDGAIITNAGQELLSYALANNKQVNFTKVKLGKGDVSTFDKAKKLTDIVSFYKQIPITSIARNNAGIVRIRSSFTNADFPLQVVLKEIGVFAVVEGKSEVLFGYVNDGEGESFPPGSSGNIVERVRDVYVGVSTNTQVTAVIDRSVVYATIYDLDEEIAKCAKKITRVNPGNGIHGGGTLGEDITISIKSNDTSINLDATNGITLKKTTSWLNDATQLFSAKGALNLFNTLTENFTDGINTVKESLRLDIVKKLNKSGDTMTGTLIMPNDRYYGSNNTCGIDLRNSDIIGTNGIYFHDISAGPGEGLMFPKKETPTNSLDDYNQFYLDSAGNPYTNINKIYHQGFNPTKADVGLTLVNNWDASSAVNDASNSKYATSGAVKRAYDKGVEALDSSTTHSLDKANPHAVTKAQLGLGNVGNYGISDVVNSTSSTTYASSKSVKTAYDKGVEALDSSTTHSLDKANPHAVTKAQLGLGNVGNYGISDVVNSTSSTTYASSKSVKTAYDKGVEALDSATTANSNANNRLLKSGGTMTGALETVSNYYYGSDNKYAINLRNSDIVGVNGMYFADACDAIGEGLLFPKGNTPTNNVDDYYQFHVKTDGNPYVDGNIIYNAKSHKFLPIIGNHTYYWTGANNAQGKKCMGGIHFDAQDNDKQYLSFAAASSQTLDIIVDGDFFCNNGNSKVFNQSFTPKMDTVQLYNGWFVPADGVWTSTSVNIAAYDYITVAISLNGSSSWSPIDTRTITLSASALKKGCELFLSLTQGGSGNTNFEAMKVRASGNVLQFANYGSGYQISNNGILQIWGDKLI